MFWCFDLRMCVIILWLLDLWASPILWTDIPRYACRTRQAAAFSQRAKALNGRGAAGAANNSEPRGGLAGSAALLHSANGLTKKLLAAGGSHGKRDPNISLSSEHLLLQLLPGLSALKLPESIQWEELHKSHWLQLLRAVRHCKGRREATKNNHFRMLWQLAKRCENLWFSTSDWK